jgi:hypothetical protein|tara:strand:+ start:531 stop:770 length:240 start_codon:yes stop_codon:yes gene_type:complete
MLAAAVEVVLVIHHNGHQTILKEAQVECLEILAQEQVLYLVVVMEEVIIMQEELEQLTLAVVQAAVVVADMLVLQVALV